jgi:hypothetical protein
MYIASYGSVPINPLVIIFLLMVYSYTIKDTLYFIAILDRHWCRLTNLLFIVGEVFLY